MLSVDRLGMNPGRGGQEDVLSLSVMKRNKTKLLWAAAGGVSWLAACGVTLYKAVLNRMEKRFDAHCQDLAIQTMEGEGGIVLD